MLLPIFDKLKKKIVVTFSLLLTTYFTVTHKAKATVMATEATQKLYSECGLNDVIPYNTFQQSIKGFQHFQAKKSIITIVDFTLPSTEKRCFIIDIHNKKLLFTTWVAHGKNSGDIRAETFSNTLHSYQSSPGFYMVGKKINTAKHGMALLLFGLEKGINDNALRREIIVHGASYVSEEFIKQYGRLGRSHGCPALPNELMPIIAPIIADGSLLYIHIGEK